MTERRSGSSVVIRADARHLPLPDNSVDLVCTSPPYWSLRDYRDGDASLEGQIGNEASPGEYLESLWECTREWMRVLKPEGSLWLNLGDKYATAGGGTAPGGNSALAGRTAVKAGIYTPGTTRAPEGFRVKSLLGIPWRYAIGCIDELGLILRAEVIWAKPNGLPESVTDRVRRSHEHWFHFTAMPRYYSAVDEIREPHRMKPQRRPNGHQQRQKLGVLPAQTYSTSQRDEKGVDGHPLGALPGSVWEIATQPLKVPADLGVDHFAAFPMEFPRRIIRGWSPVGGLVVDPFGGTGTTALVASVLGRHGVSVDRSAGYCRIAQWRTTDPGERARALGVPRPPATHPDQAALFEAS